MQELARDQAPALARLARRGCQIPQNFPRHRRNRQILLLDKDSEYTVRELKEKALGVTESRELDEFNK